MRRGHPADLIPVVIEPHVVTQLVCKRPAAAVEAGEAEGAGNIGAAAVVMAADNQVHQIRPDAVAPGVHIVYVTVRQPRQPAEIDAGVSRFSVRHL